MLLNCLDALQAMIQEADEEAYQEIKPKSAQKGSTTFSVIDAMSEVMPMLEFESEYCTP